MRQYSIALLAALALIDGAWFTVLVGQGRMTLAAISGFLSFVLALAAILLHFMDRNLKQ